jgi:hypothetical protein
MSWKVWCAGMNSQPAGGLESMVRRNEFETYGRLGIRGLRAVILALKIAL